MRPPADTAITPRVLSQHALERVAQRQREYRASAQPQAQRSQAIDAVAAPTAAPGCQRAVVRTRRTRMRGSPKRYHRRCSRLGCAVAIAAADEAEALSVAAGLAGRRRPPTPRRRPAGGTASGAKAHPVLSGLQRQSERDIGSARAGARGRNNIGAASRALALASCDRDRDRTRPRPSLRFVTVLNQLRSTEAAVATYAPYEMLARVARHVPAGCAARDVRVALRSGGPDARRPCR